MIVQAFPFFHVFLNPSIYLKMSLEDIRKYYLDSLSSVYPPKEIKSLFLIAAEYALGMNRMQIRQRMSKNTSPEAEKKMLAILSRLKKTEPIQYITGTSHFYDLEIFVTPDVLIPRQETELLVDMVLRENPGNQNISIIDLCTGSGCIALALAKNLSRARMAAMDISEKALSIAGKNAREYHINLDLMQDDLLNPAARYGQYDLIVSNPPYVRASEKFFMHDNILLWEPESALFVSDDQPMIFYEAIIEFATDHLAQEGKIYLEINEAMGNDLASLYTKNSFRNVEICKDLSGKDRYLKCSN